MRSSPSESLRSRVTGGRRGAGQPYKAAFEGRLAGERFDGTGPLGAQECKLAISRAQ
jgi:hypothetical protein